MQGPKSLNPQVLTLMYKDVLSIDDFVQKHFGFSSDLQRGRLFADEVVSSSLPIEHSLLPDPSLRQGRPVLLLDTDSAEFRVQLLQQSFAVLNDKAPRFRGNQAGPDTTGCTQNELVQRVIELHFQKSSRPTDVLCQGHQRANTYARKQGQALPGASGIECLALNSAFATLTSPSWTLLLNRIGAPAMLHLLLHASVFTPLQNGCLLQVSGRPITDLVWKKRLQPSGTKAPTKPKKRRPKMVSPQDAKSNHIRFSLGKRRCPHRSSDVATGACEQTRSNLARGEGEQTQRKRRRRPASGCTANLQGGEESLPKGVEVGPSGARLKSHKRRMGARRSKAGVPREVQSGMVECRDGPFETVRREFAGASETFIATEGLCDKEDSPSVSHVSDSGSEELPLSQEPVVSRIRGGSDQFHVALSGRRIYEPVQRVESLASNLEEADSHGLAKYSSAQIPDPGPFSQDDVARDLEPREPDIGQGEGAKDQTRRKNKRIRASSWQRRKRRKADEETTEVLRESHREETLSQEFSLAEPQEKSYRVVIRGKGAAVAVSRKRAPSAIPMQARLGESVGRKIATLQTEESQRSREQPRPSKRARRYNDPVRMPPSKPGKNASVLDEQRATKKQAAPVKGSPKKTAKAGPRHLPRAAIFYNASHGRKAGLPISHILSSLGTDASAAKALVWEVFEPQLASQRPTNRPQTTSFQAAFGSLRPEKHSDKGKTERRVPKQLRAVLPLFQELLSRVNTLDFGRLLARYCPLPAELKTKKKRTTNPRSPGLSGDIGEARSGAGMASQPPVADSGKEVCAVELGPREPASEREEVSREQPLIWGLADDSDGYITQEEEAGDVPFQTFSEPTFSEEEGSDDGEKGVLRKRVEPSNQVQEPAKNQEHPVHGAQEKTCATPQLLDASLEGLSPLLPDHLGPQQESTYKQLIGQFCEHRQVAAFVWSALCKLVPAPLLGGAHRSASARALRGHVNRFIRLGRFETMSIDELMHGLRLQDFPWLWESVNGALSKRGDQGTVLRENRGTGEKVQDLFEENRVEETTLCDEELPLTQERLASDSGLREEADSAKDFPPPSQRLPKLSTEKMSQLRQSLSNWLLFLFSKLVIPLLRTHFYITESEPHKQKVFYYRKPVWRQLATLSVRQLATLSVRQLAGPRGPYCHVAPREAEALLSRAGRNFGPAALRLLPKANGMRPIARQGPSRVVTISKVAEKVAEAPFKRKRFEEPKNDRTIRRKTEESNSKRMPAADNSGQSRGKGAAARAAELAPALGFKVLEFPEPNKLLRDAHAILKYEKWRGLEDLGCSVFGFDDVHAKLRPFLRAVKHRGEEMPKIYMAGCDIAAAYDTIPQEFLWKIVEALFRSPIYQLLWNARATPAFGALRVRGEKVATSVDASGDHVPFRAFQDVVQRLTSHKSGGAVFVDQVNCYDTAREKQLRLVHEHLFGSLVRYGRAYLHQRVGIPQGSILSTLFCSFFYGHLERHVLLPFLADKAREETSLSDMLAKNSRKEAETTRRQAEMTGKEAETTRRGAETMGNEAEKNKERRGKQKDTGELREGTLLGQRRLVRSRNGADSLREKSAFAPEDAFLDGEGGNPPLPIAEARDLEHMPSPPRTPEKEALPRTESSSSSEEENELFGGKSDGDSRCFGGLVTCPPLEFRELEQGYASQEEGVCGGMFGGDSHEERSQQRKVKAGVSVEFREGPLSQGFDRTGIEQRLPVEPSDGRRRKVSAGDHGINRRKGKSKRGKGKPEASSNEREARVSPPQSLLIRWVDDSLFLSTSKRHVTAYVHVMHEGFPAYGAEANAAKTCLNFELEGERKRALPLNMYVDGRGRSFIRWCGLLLNSETLEVQADYTRYSGEYVRDSMAVDLTKGHQGAVLADRLSLWLRPKCHAVFFDTAINSPVTVRLNIYQAFLLCAVKFHCFLTAAGGSVESNPQFLAREIRKAFGYMGSAVRNAKQAACRRGTGCSGKVPQSQILWLGLHAFCRVLRRKLTRYKPLLELLVEDFGRESKQLSKTLQDVVARDLSAAFDQMLY